MSPRTLRAIAAALTAISRALLAEAQTLPRFAPLRPRRRSPRLTRARRAQLKLQGAYIGSMRGLPVAKKARVKREREKRGFAAAIRLARRLQ